jgi:hypothetical protein
MKLQSSTPPPQEKSPESVGSNMGQTIEFQYLLGEKTPPSQAYNYSVSPHSQGPSSTPPLAQTTKPPHQHIPTHTTSPQFVMPISMWNPNSSIQTTPNHSLSFQQQPFHTSNQAMWPIPNSSNQHTPLPNTYQANTTYTQPSPYIPTTYPYYQQPTSSGHPNWPRPQTTWPKTNYTNQYTPQHHTQPNYQNKCGPIEN